MVGNHRVGGDYLGIGYRSNSNQENEIGDEHEVSTGVIRPGEAHAHRAPFHIDVCRTEVAMDTNRRRVRLSFLTAAVIGGMLGVWFASCDVDNQPDAQALRRDFDCAVPGHVIASGVLTSSASPGRNGLTENYWTVNHTTILLPANLPYDQALALYKGKVVEIVVREVEPFQARNTHGPRR